MTGVEITVPFKVSAKIEGLEELVKQLREELPKKMQTKILRKAIGDGSKIILKAAKRKVEKGETGLLKKSLGRRIKVYRNSGAVVAIVGPRKGYKTKKKGGLKFRETTKLGEAFAAAEVNPVKYAHLVEKGTKSHKIALTNKQGFNYLTIQHPGAVAKPFLRPALDSNIAQLKQIFTTVIRDGLEKNRIGSVESEGVKGD